MITHTQWKTCSRGISSPFLPSGFQLVHRRRAVLRLTLNLNHACTMVLSNVNVSSTSIGVISTAKLFNLCIRCCIASRKVQSRGKQKLGTERKRKHTRKPFRARKIECIYGALLVYYYPRHQQATAANHASSESVIDPSAGSRQPVIAYHFWLVLLLELSFSSSMSV